MKKALDGWLRASEIEGAEPQPRIATTNCEGSALSELELAARNSQPSHQSGEGRAMQPKVGGRGGDHSVSVPKNLENVLSLHFLQREPTRGIPRYDQFTHGSAEGRST